MPAKPSVEKLPLAARKSFRDDFDAKKAGWEKELSEIFGVPWTIEANPNELYAYVSESDSSMKAQPGAAAAQYFEKGIEKLQEFKKQYDAMGVQTANQLASKHVLTLAQDDSTTYSSCVVRDGAIVIIFADHQFGSWVSGALGDLPAALDAAETAATGPYSFQARFSVARDYDPAIAAVQKRVAETLAMPDVTLNPRHEENAKVMAGTSITDWKEDWGRNMLKIMTDAAQGLEDAGFKGDDMMQEALAEAMTGKELGIYFGAEEVKGQWNAVAIKDGNIHLQFDAQYYSTTITGNMRNLIDLL